MPEYVSDSVKESLGNIESNIGYINKIVADLQDFSRPLKPDLVEVSNLCYAIEQSLLTVNIPSNIKPQMRFDKDLPKVKLDLNFFKRILVNLATNAVQAMPNGGNLTISAFGNAKSIFVTVEDTGVGVPERIKPKLFTPMVTTKSQGQGLGLAVVKRLIEALNGAITFESQEGEGTKFTIQLPLNNSNPVV